MLEIADRAVIYSGQIVLVDEETSFRLTLENGIILDVRFVTDAALPTSAFPRFSDGIFTIELTNFGSSLGMAVSGIIRAETTTGGQSLDRNGAIRPGAWMFQYALTTHTIGDDKPTRLVNITISEKRVA
ncbi:hypothetical protein J2Y48_003156 [Mycoplana sp. BE70]|uniref:hypothetical protein n=1 Tax=Mycoplana sp. BE70 TaxID=2817775 RepID=UPI00285C216A|nr:hypothetical protein [Mycoplana sp. BE70]MDR6757859.1 hypothetical protein [Mycoplana sp. BE70]